MRKGTTSAGSARPGPAPVVALVLAACAAPASEADAPLSHAVTRWEHLAARHDADGDGRIAPDEYDRGPESFARLDADGDGFVGPEDFDPRWPSPAQLLAQALLDRYFDLADDPAALGVDQVEVTLAEYDADLDDRLDRDEFERVLRERGGRPYPAVMAALLQGTSEFDGLLAVVDRDGDGRLSRPELVGYHRARYDATFVRLFLDEPPPEALAGGGPGPGDPAPDFTLRPPGGGPSVTLSSFAGERPVALVFGSYS